MTTVTFIRHGESEANVYNYQKSVNTNIEKIDLLDSPLTNNGRKQAIKLQKYTKKMKFDGIFVSPLIRACETASIAFADQKVYFCIKRCCRELQHDTEECQGRLASDLINGSYDGKLNYRPALKNLPGGIEKFYNLEKIEKWSKRWNNIKSLKQDENISNLNKLMNTILQNKGKHICIVCHGSVIKSITGLTPTNCAMIETRIDYVDNKWSINNEFMFNAL
jgi:broad specificity phosphatase PhoE